MLLRSPVAPTLIKGWGEGKKNVPQLHNLPVRPQHEICGTSINS